MTIAHPTPAQPPAPDYMLDQLDQAPELAPFTEGELHEIGNMNAADRDVIIAAELREIRILLATFAQLGAAMGQLTAGGGGMLGRMLGLGGG